MKKIYGIICQIQERKMKKFKIFYLKRRIEKRKINLKTAEENNNEIENGSLCEKINEDKK